MKITEVIRPKEVTQVPEPPIARFLFADTRMAWLWLIVRLYVGYQWITAGLDKLTGYSFTFDGSFGQKVSSPWVFGWCPGPNWWAASSRAGLVRLLAAECGPAQRGAVCLPGHLW